MKDREGYVNGVKAATTRRIRLRFWTPTKYAKKQKFIIRCDRAGVFYGEITELRHQETVADLANVRRVHGWDGANSLSQLATEGLKKQGGNNRWSVVVPAMTVGGVIERIPVSAEVAEFLDNVPVWKQ